MQWIQLPSAFREKFNGCVNHTRNNWAIRPNVKFYLPVVEFSYCWKWKLKMLFYRHCKLANLVRRNLVCRYIIIVKLSYIAIHHN